MFLELTSGEGRTVLANFDLVEHVSKVDQPSNVRSILNFAHGILRVQEDFATIQQLLRRRQME